METDLATRRRREIIEASIKVISEKGYHATRIEDIAAELGMGHGTFYRYFENKKDIFDHVTSYIVQSITEVVAGERPDESDSLQEYREQLFRIGDGMFRVFIDNSHISKILFYEIFGLGEEMEKRIQEIFDLFGRYTEMYLINGVEKEFLRQDLHTRQMALAINAMIFEAARRLAQSQEPEVEYKLWLESIVDIMTRGLGAESQVKKVILKEGM
jgi:AcrR family transcriptional regulator